MRLTVAFLLAILCHSVFAEKSTRTEYYPIFGTSARQLINEIDSKGPQGFSGYTTHDFRYEYRTRMINSRCRVSQMHLDLNILYTMPRWENKSSADLGLRSRWDAWYQTLDQHERNHGAFAEKGYNDILNEWRKIGTSDNCQNIRNQVEQIYNSITARVRQENSVYDSSTNHGESEGVTRQRLIDNNLSATPASRNGDIDYWWLIFAALIGLLFYVRKS